MIRPVGRLRRGTFHLIIVVCTALFLPAGTATAVPAFKEMPPEVRRSMAEGLAAARQKDWKRAIQHFEKSRKVVPYESEVLFSLALAYDKDGQDFIAIPVYRAYLASAPDDPRANQVRVRVVELESQAEHTVRRLLRRAEEAIPEIEAFLYNDKSALIYAYAITTPPAEKRRDINALREAYRDKHSARINGHLAISQTKARELFAARKTAESIRDAYINPKPGAHMNGSDVMKYRELIENIVAAQAEAGDFTGARETAARIKGECYRSIAFYKIARIQIVAGHVADARETAGHITCEEYKSLAREHIAIQQAEAGDFTGARKTVAAITGETVASKSDLYRKIDITQRELAFDQVKAGNLTSARENASKITDSQEKSYVYLEIVHAQAKVGDIAGAKDTAARITDESSKSYAYSAIAAGQVSVGDIAGARETVAKVTGEGTKSSVSAAIARTLAERGDIARALNTAAGITVGSSRSEAYLEIAKVQGKAGDKTGARKALAQAVEAIKEPLDISRLIHIVWVQIEIGDFAGARKAISLFPDGDPRNNLSGQLATAQAGAGDIVGAKETASRIKYEHVRTNAYRNIVNAQLKAGDIPGALKTASTIDNDHDTSNAYLDIARANAKAGDKTGAEKALALAKESAASHENYIGIANFQFALGDLSGAKRTLALGKKAAARMRDDPTSGPWQSSGYGEIALAQAAIGDIAGAHETAAHIANENYKSSTYSEIAKIREGSGEKTGNRTKEQGQNRVEVDFWWQVAAQDGFSEAMFKDLPGYLVSLKGKPPPEVVDSLAQAAGKMADALKEFREKEAEWLKQLNR